jgi:hypothetical protein
VDGPCQIVNGLLTLADWPVPILRGRCLVEASAPASGGRAATPRRALITIDYPTFMVSVDPVPAIDWSELTRKEVTVHVHEDSGAAYVVSVGWDYVTAGSPGDGGAPCGGGAVPASGYSAPNTREYEVTVGLRDPGSASYTCSMEAHGGPANIAGFSKAFRFTITVNP